MQNLSGKKLLIIGGAFQHCKLVEAAKELDITTYVTDYLPVENAPAKQIADKYYTHNITDIDDIVEMCKSEGIDGVISTSLDACQKPYFHVCERLGFPCFGNEEQFHILTDKTAFKKCCETNGIDIIPEYQLSDFDNEEICSQKVQFPIIIKPCDSRGSRGQTICNTFTEAKQAIIFAKSESSSGNIIIEKYLGRDNDFSMSILVLNGQAYTFRTVDRFLGKPEDGLDKLAIGSISPSRFTNIYMKNAHEKVNKLIKAIRLKNAPIFMQGFVDEDRIRFYDPGLRLPGGEYERIFSDIFNKNPLYPLIEYALTGTVSSESLKIDRSDVWLNGKIAVQILPTLKDGIITSIKGLDEIRKHPNIISVYERFKKGDIIEATHNVNQRFAEIDIVCDNKSDMEQTIDWVYSILDIRDQNDADMIISRCDFKNYLKHY